MTYSKTHQLFSNYLKQPDALTDPDKYLGPNYKDVLNFWIYVDTLSQQKKNKMNDHYLALDLNLQDSADGVAWLAADEVVSEKFSQAAWAAAWDVTVAWVFGSATYELIGHHKLLEQNQTPLALQYCIQL